MTVIWCMVPEIWSARDRIFCHSGMLFVLLTPYGPRKSKLWKNEKMPGNISIFHKSTITDNHMMYRSWYMKREWQNVFIILDCFLPSYPTNNTKNQNFQKLKKIPGDIIILHKCTKNNDHMLYCSLDMARNRFNCYFSFWAFINIYLYMLFTIEGFWEVAIESWPEWDLNSWPLNSVQTL